MLYTKNNSKFKMSILRNSATVEDGQNLKTVTIREQIKKLIIQAIKKAQEDKDLPIFKLPKISVERISSGDFGDFTTNSAIAISAITQMLPTQVTEILNDKLKIIADDVMEPTEFIAPVFQNIKLKKEFLQSQVAEILRQGKNYGAVETHHGVSLQNNKKIQVEFISANPTGPLTVGNARGGPFGDALANVLAQAGYEIKRAYYVNDLGNQILALGHSVLKDKEAVYKGEYLDELHKKIKDKDPFKTGQKAAKIIIDDYIKKTVKKAGIQFDQWYFESSLHQSGEVDQVLKNLEKKGLLYKKEGAVWFKSTKFGDKRDRVLVKSDGQKTYLAGDLALHCRKFEKDRFDEVINIWGADHAGDVAGLQAGVSALGHQGKLKIILTQFVTILDKGERLKISKRKGTIVTLDDLLALVGPDVFKFFFLQKSANTHLEFDLALAQEQSEKNPVFYVQYAYARIHSILAKSQIPKSKFQILNSQFNLLNHSSELELIKELMKLPEIIEDIAQDYQVHRLPTYAMALAASFHRFYKNCRVLGNDDKNLDEARLALILATKIVLKNTLSLMGISAPERM